ncbi:hypothetical protein ASD77_15865 [Pseudoxanthomonas sp. Root65]|nr:hypothetical protein ASD77_15865 [Pseudoxanthomonas sp. Root65]
MREFEEVLQLDDWYDGPRAGIALYRGVPHAFRSRMLDVTEYWDDFESADIFELSRLGDADASPKILAAAEFRRRQDSPDTGLEVRWSTIELPSA